ncbi:hypothetical protein [Sphingopyxis sp.]|uniref:hypothetical protein n=1 Tax=Sphingopyxis sp. TaxID=1908224 RepID=UPI003BA9F3E9
MTTGDSDASKLLYESIIERERKLAAAKAERDKKPFVVPDISEAFDDTYAQCILPSAALERFKFSTRELSVTQMHRELKSSRVQAVCHEAISFINGMGTRISRAMLDSWVWHVDVPAPDDGFWETGYFRILVPETMGRTSWQGEIEFFGIRFWPDGLPGGVDNPLPSQRQEPSGDDALKPDVSQADLDRWHEIFTAIHPNAVEDFAIRSARAMFPENKVARQRVRDLRGPQKRGKPAIRDK